MLLSELDLLIVVCLLIDNPNKEYIVLPFINKATYDVYVAILSFCCFQKIILDSFNYLCFTSCEPYRHNHVP
jgi:hypothetical protein